MNWFRQMSLRQRIIFSIVACLVVPSVIAVKVSSYYTRDALRDQAAAHAQESLDVAELYVTNLIDSMIYITNNIQFDSKMATMLKDLGKQSTESVLRVKNGQQVTERLETLVLTKEKMYISLLLPNGAFYTNYSGAEFTPTVFREESWFSQLDALTVYDIYWLGPQTNYIQSRKQDSPNVITMARVLRNGLDHPYAYLIISIEEQTFRNFFNRYRPNQEMVLLNEEGLVMAHSKQENLGTPYPYLSLLPEQSGANFVKSDGEEIVLTNKVLSFSGWQLVNRVPYETAIKQISEIRKTDYTIQLLFLIIFIIFLWLVVNRITKPILVLAKVASSVKRGALNIRANIKGEDEIARFGRVFDEMLDNTELMIQQIVDEQTRKRKAELELLQAQINPHFLFNLLNSIRLKIRLKGDQENAALIASLSKLLRMTINRNNEFVTIQEEIEVVEHYVLLMNVRHNQKIQFGVDASTDVCLEEIPRLTIQPLIENAFIHGLEQKRGQIDLVIWKESDFLMITVKDDGNGMTEDQLSEVVRNLNQKDNSERSTSRVNGIGLQNVNERLLMIYGPAFNMEVRSQSGEGTEMRLRIPLRTYGGDRHV